MTTTTRALPDHGTTARAKTCGCPPCRAAQNRRNKHRRYLNTTGRPVRVPAAPVARHLRRLFDAGTPWGHVAAGANVSTWTLRSLLQGQEKISRTVAERILAVEPYPGPRFMVDATGAIRMVRALTALGHRSKDIVAESDVEHATVSDLLNGRPATVRLDTHRRLAGAYEALSMVVPEPSLGAVRAVNRAVREGWPPPLAWGEDIDDPAAVPSGHVAAPREPTGAERVEDMRWLIGNGMSRDLVADHFGVTRGAIDRALERERAAAPAATSP